MVDPVPITDAVRAQHVAEQLQRETERRLPPAGGGGTSGGMEERVARIESDMEHVKRTLDKVDGKASRLETALADQRVDIATLSGKLDVLAERMGHLPTKSYAVAVIMTILAAFGGVAGLMYRLMPPA